MLRGAVRPFAYAQGDLGLRPQDDRKDHFEALLLCHPEAQWAEGSMRFFAYAQNDL